MKSDRGGHTSDSGDPNPGDKGNEHNRTAALKGGWKACARDAPAKVLCEISRAPVEFVRPTTGIVFGLREKDHRAGDVDVWFQP